MTKRNSQPKRRRNRGEDSVYQRASDHRWMCEIRDGYRADGKPKVRYLSERGYPDTTKENRRLNVEARKRLLERRDEARYKLRSGQWLDQGNVTVAAWLDSWLANYVKPNRRLTTYQSYESVCRIHLKPILGRKHLATLKRMDVQELMARMKEAGASPATVKNARGILRKAINDAMRDDLVSRNVVTLTDMPDQESYEAKPLKAAEIPKLLAAAKDDRLLGLWQTFLMTGMRAGEAYGLRWQDVDFDNAEITIRQQIQHVYGGDTLPGDGKRTKRAEVVPPKTEASKASIPMFSELVEALRAHKERQMLDQVAAGGRWQGKEWQHLVFCTTVGTPLDPSNTLRAFREAMAAAGLDTSTRIHDLRHTCATMLARLKVNPKAAQRILRHADLMTTLRIYTHVDDDTLRETADLLGGLVFPVEGLEGTE